MKKLASILLLSLLLFNWIGYQLYIAVLELRADEEMIARLDKNNFNESDLVSIKVPVNYLYYYEGTTVFERIDGHAEINGVTYNYVKRRFVNDSLELMCIPNKTATQLKTAKNTFFTLVNDLQHPDQSKKSGQHNDAFKSLNGKYFPASDLFVLQAMTSLVGESAGRYAGHLLSVYIRLSTPPPDAA
jgi:hypothetical protein